MNDLPLYKVSEDDVQMVAISLVDTPAVDSPLYAFSKQRINFSIQDEENHIILAPVIRVDYPILRKDNDGSLYNIVFTKECAQKMVSEYLTAGYANNINLSHSSFFPSSVIPLSFFTKRVELGINPLPEIYGDVAEGSVFAEFKILDESIWKACKDGTFGGLSLEMYASRVPADEFSSLSIYDLLTTILTQ